MLYFLADNGSMYFWDWKTGYNFQRMQATVQPGSLDSEAGIFSMTFDMSGYRLITTEADKTIKIYKEDESAVSYTFGEFMLEELIPRHFWREGLLLCTHILTFAVHFV